jgi:hypothetical protein
MTSEERARASRLERRESLRRLISGERRGTQNVDNLGMVASQAQSKHDGNTNVTRPSPSKFVSPSLVVPHPPLPTTVQCQQQLQSPPPPAVFSPDSQALPPQPPPPQPVAPPKTNRKGSKPKEMIAAPRLPPSSTQEANPTQAGRPVVVPMIRENSLESSTDVLGGISSSGAGYTEKDTAAMMGISANIQPSGLDDLRVGDTKKIYFSANQDLHNRLTPKLKKRQANDLVVELINQRTNASLPGIATQGILELMEATKTYSVTLLIRTTTEDAQYDINLYGPCKLKLVCKDFPDIPVLEQVVPFKPALSTIPFPFLKFRHATKGTALDNIDISIALVIVDSLKATSPRFQQNFTFRGTDAWHLPSDLPDGIVQVTFSAHEFKNLFTKFILHNHEVCCGEFVRPVNAIGSGVNTGAATYVGNLSPADLVEGEWRVVLRWKTEPRDLDLHCIVSKDPKHIYFANKNAGGRNIHAKGKIELDTDERNGNGPETVTFTPLKDRNYRFFVHNFSGEADPKNAVSMAKSGATITVFVGDSIREFKVNEDPVFNSQGNPAAYWNVFELVSDGERFSLREINKIVIENLQSQSLN